MVGLSPRSLYLPPKGMCRELGLQRAMRAGCSTSPGLARTIGTLLLVNDNKNASLLPPQSIHLGRRMRRRCPTQRRLDG